MKEILIKIAIVILLFLSTFFVFSSLQNKEMFDSTLGQLTQNYGTYTADNKISIYETEHPYEQLNDETALKWDGNIYYNIRQNYYNNGDSKYSFFPLFPLFWKATQAGILSIGLINYLLFAFSVMLFSFIFLKQLNISLFEKNCIFALAIILPPIISYYLPYAEALFSLTFAMALWGLIKKKYWLFGIFMLLFAMTRPVFMIVGLSFIIIEIFYFIRHRNFAHLLKQLLLKLAPFLLGTFIVFFLFFLNSGSFFKYFESNNTYWNVTFGFPSKISDWSIEGYGMNIFAIFFVIFPSAFFLLKNFIQLLKSPKTIDLPTVFKGDESFIKEYFLNLSMVYFWGVFCYTLFFQDGSLNGLSRYIMASPFFYIYLFSMVSMLRKIKVRTFLILAISLSAASFLMLTCLPKLDPAINFRDSGFFTLLLDFFLLFSFRYMRNYLKVIALVIIAFYNIIWITYLYDIYLCDGWIFT
jgi:hypothetical protein